jgi:hypothetical protein
VRNWPGCVGRTARLTGDAEILKRATAFFAKETPVNVYPFIEAEKSERRAVAQPCASLKDCPVCTQLLALSAAGAADSTVHTR